MKKRLLLLLLACCALQLTAGPQPLLDVRKYFAKYSKKGDDTEAFKQLFKDIATYRWTAVCLPPGTYYLTDTISLDGIPNGEIYGHGYPEIIMKDPTKDIFKTNWSWKLRISGLAFKGGRNQLALGNNNIDRTVISISNCKFKQASGFAIHLGEKTASAHVSISDCSFYENYQTLYTATDGTILQNSWITTNRNMKDCAVIVNYGGELTLQHVLGVPLVAQGPQSQHKQRWIDHHGLKLTCRDVRFGGEGGGLPIVYSFRQFRWKSPIVAGNILLTDCWLYCARTEAIRFYEIPNRVRIENCTGLVDARFFTFMPSLDLNFLRERLTSYPRLILIETDHTTEPNHPSVVPDVLRNCVHSPYKMTFVKDLKK